MGGGGHTRDQRGQRKSSWEEQAPLPSLPANGEEGGPNKGEEEKRGKAHEKSKGSPVLPIGWTGDEEEPSFLRAVKKHESPPSPPSPRLRANTLRERFFTLGGWLLWPQSPHFCGERSRGRWPRVCLELEVLLLLLLLLLLLVGTRCPGECGAAGTGPSFLQDGREERGGEGGRKERIQSKRERTQSTCTKNSRAN